MLHRVKRLQGMSVGTADGEIGSVADVYFDIERWGLRYIVVDIGSRLSPGRKALISPRSIRASAWTGDALHVSLTRQEIEDSPPIDTTRPLLRRDEIAHAAYYGYPFYWNGPYLWGLGADPTAYASARHPPFGSGERVAYGITGGVDPALADAEKSYLRSCGEVIGYGIEASDGAIGRVDDFVIDSETWGIPYLVIDKRSWLPGGKVLVLPDEVEDIDPVTRRVRLTITREDVKESPSYS